MSYLIDTNVLSEVRRPRPDARVLHWLDQVDEDRVHLSVISIAEIARGIGLMEEGRRKDALGDWLALDLLERFEERILAIDSEIALVWGELMVVAQRQGLALGAMDGLIAATAASRGLTVVTRNIKDFIGLNLALINPWEGQEPTI